MRSEGFVKRLVAKETTKSSWFWPSCQKFGIRSPIWRQLLLQITWFLPRSSKASPIYNLMFCDCFQKVLQLVILREELTIELVVAIFIESCIVKIIFFDRSTSESPNFFNELARLMSDNLIISDCGWTCATGLSLKKKSNQSWPDFWFYYFSPHM